MSLRLAIVVVLGAALLLAVPFLGSVHLFDWDEINFAQAAREMNERGDWLQVTIAGQPFYEKPPLYFWLQAGVFSLFGESEAAARLPSALATVLTALLLFNVGRRLKDITLGTTWAFLYLCSFLPLMTGRMGLIDPVFNLLIALGLLALFEMDRRRPGQGSRLLALGGGAALGLAVLAKGPLGAAIPLAIFLLYRLFGRDGRMLVGPWLLFLLAMVVSAGSWFLAETLVHGPEFMGEFIRYQVRLLQTGDAGHSGFPGYELVVFLFGCFPLSVFAVRGLFRRAGTLRLRRFTRLTRIWLLLILVLFALVRTKIPHYTSLTYMPGAFLAALEWEALRRRLLPARTTRILWAVVGSVLALVLLALPLLMRHRGLWIDQVADPFARANILRPGDWPWTTLLPGIVFTAGLVAAWILIARRRWRNALQLQLAATALCAWLAWPLLLPRIESHSQGGAIGFYESLAEEPVDLCIAGFKSYAHLYYSGRHAFTAMDEVGQARLAAPGERPLYLVVPIHRVEEVRSRWPAEEIARDGGFVLLQRRF